MVRVICFDLQAVDLAHFLALDGFQAHDQVQVLLVPHRGLAEHEPHVQDTETAHFEVIRQQRRTLADHHVRADAENSTASSAISR